MQFTLSVALSLAPLLTRMMMAVRFLLIMPVMLLPLDPLLLLSLLLLEWNI